MRGGRIKKEMNTVCSECIEDIQFLKQQQWRVVYYCLLLFGAIFYLLEEDILSQWILAIASFVITFFGLYFQIDFQRGMQKNRIYIGKIRYKYFSNEIKKLFNLTNKKKVKEYGSFCNGWEYLFVFYLTILAGFGLLIFMIWESFIWMPLSVLALLVLPIIIYWIKEKIKDKGGGNMKKKSKGFNRLSILCGGLCLLWSLVITIALFMDKTTAINWTDWRLIILANLGVFLIGWGIMRGTYRIVYWIYSGFKDDTKKGEPEEIIEADNR